MSKLPRLPAGATVKGDDFNLLAAAIDAGGLANIQSQTTAAGITGQGLSPQFPPASGSINPGAGASGTPNTPTGLTLNYGIDNYSQTHDGYILISWTPNPVSDNISRYDIYWHKGSDPNLHQLTVGGDVSSARVNSVIPGQTYIFAIQSHDTAGRGSQFSMEQSITISPDVDPPAIPSGFTATAIGNGVLLTWTEVGVEGISNDLKQYSIAVSTDGGSTFPTTYTVGPGNSFFYIPSLGAFGAGVTPTFTFKLAATDWTGNTSVYSATASATLTGALTLSGELEVTNGDSSGAAPGPENIAQIEFGWAGSRPVPQYQQWISTQHLGGGAAGNRIEFWTSDGTANGVFPTNAIIGLYVENGQTIIPSSTGVKELALTNAGDKIVLGASSTNSRIQLGTSAGNTWEIDNSSGTLRIFQPGTVYATLTTSLFHSVPVVQVDNGVNFGSGNTGIVAPDIHSDGTEVFIEASASNIFLRPQGANNSQSQLVITNAGGAGITRLVPDTTKLILSNNANNADNLAIADIGDVTIRRGLDLSNGNNWTAPTSAGGVGDKILLYGASGGANNYGFGIQASTLVAYIPNGAAFAVRQATGTGNNSAGTTLFTVSGSTGAIVVGGTVTANGSGTPTSSGLDASLSSVTVSGNNIRGQISITAGGGGFTPPKVACTINWSGTNPHSATPRVLVVNSSGAASADASHSTTIWATQAESTSSFTLVAIGGGGMNANATVTVDYWAIE